MRQILVQRGIAVKVSLLKIADSHLPEYVHPVVICQRMVKHGLFLPILVRWYATLVTLKQQPLLPAAIISADSAILVHAVTAMYWQIAGDHLRDFVQCVIGQ